MESLGFKKAHNLFKNAKIYNATMMFLETSQFELGFCCDLTQRGR